MILNSVRRTWRWCRGHRLRALILGITVLLSSGAAGTARALEDVLLERPPLDSRTDIQRLGLRGPVKMVRTKVRFVLGNVEEITFDKSGNRVKRIRTNRAGKVAEQQTWSYDAEGRMVEAADYQWDDDRGISGLISRSQFHYGEENGAPWCQRIDYDRAGDETGRTRYEMSEDRRSETAFDAGGAIIRTVAESFVHDDHGRLVEARRVESAGNDVKTTHHEIRYDERGNAIGEVARGEDGSTEERVEYRCDDRGARVEEIHYYPDAPDVVRERYRFDGWGNEIEWTELDRDGSVLRSRSAEVGTDEWGNWQNRVETSSYRGNRWVFRIVEYHPISG